MTYIVGREGGRRGEERRKEEDEVLMFISQQDGRAFLAVVTLINRRDNYMVTIQEVSDNGKSTHLLRKGCA
jgi:hypothetical protein